MPAAEAIRPRLATPAGGSELARESVRNQSGKPPDPVPCAGGFQRPWMAFGKGPGRACSGPRNRVPGPAACNTTNGEFASKLAPTCARNTRRNDWINSSTISAPPRDPNARLQNSATPVRRFQIQFRPPGHDARRVDHVVAVVVVLLDVLEVDRLLHTRPLVQLAQVP